MSPIDGIGPEQLHIPELIERIKRDNVQEIILATNASVEGESTALYIQKHLEEQGVDISITRLARGIPIGVDLEYADMITLTHALEGGANYNDRKVGCQKYYVYQDLLMSMFICAIQDRLKRTLLSRRPPVPAGGFTTICDMPNNAEPIFSAELLDDKRQLAATKAVCDLGFHYGSMGDNIDTFEEAAKHAVALKSYLNNTTGGYTLDAARLKEIYAAWPQDKVVMLHTEEDTIDIAIESLDGLNCPVHVCHMPSREVLEKIIAAKKKGYSCHVRRHTTSSVFN